MKINVFLFLITAFTFFVLKNVNALVKEKKSGVSVVVIDAGHGGKDPGASVGRAKEKDIVLDIAMKLGTTISDNFPDVKVVYTRTKDIFIPLHKRAEIANKNEADLFISIHVNAVDIKSVRGTETFVLGLHNNKANLEVAKKENAVILLEDDYNTTYEGFDPNSPESYIMFANIQEAYQEQSIKLASDIQDEFKGYAKRIDRSVKMAGFLVLRRTTMPSVLIETGFLSHAEERKFLTSETGRTRLAYSIFRAFRNYKSEIEQHSSFNLVTNTQAKNQKQPSPEKNAGMVTESKEIPKQTTAEITPKSISLKAKNDIYFSVQIIALKRELATTPANFKDEQQIFRIEGNNINRYFSGKFKTLQEAEKEQKRISKKYANAFVVAFENNKLISVKKYLQQK